MAHTNRQGKLQPKRAEPSIGRRIGDVRQEVPNSYSGDAEGLFGGGVDPQERQEPRERSAGLRDRGGWPEWPPEPRMGRTFNGLARGLDRSGVFEDAEAEECGANEVLRYLQEGIGAEALQWATGGLDAVSATEVLFAFLREYEAGGRIPRELLASQTTPEGLLRAMQENRQPACAPLRRRQIEQYFGEYPDALRELSRLVASRGATPWSNPLWEGSVPRVVNNCPHRVDRITALGNGQVPRVAAGAWLRLNRQHKR